METTRRTVQASEDDYDFDSTSQAQSFLIARAINHANPPFQIAADVEMVDLQSIGYTSLKDILPAESKPPGAASPLIKDPLVQHAACAYLQPKTMTAREDDGRSSAPMCSELFGCFPGVVWTTIKRLFSESENGGDVHQVD